MATGKMITVRAGKNGPVFLPVPLQGRRTINYEPIEVENTRFIRGRIAAGDLVEVKETPPAPAPPPAPVARATKKES